MTLQATFHHLCTLYFPRWRAADQWTIREGPRAHWHRGNDQRSTSEQGYCDHVTKTIWINVSGRDLHAAIIHETCHAVAGGYHGIRWQRRMVHAQIRAATLGDTPLAEALANDLEMYQRPGLRANASSIYGRIEDILLDVPALTFDQVVDAIADDCSMTPDEVLHRYRRLRYWYARHRRDLAEDARGQLQAMDRFGLNLATRADLQQRLEALTR